VRRKGVVAAAGAVYVLLGIAAWWHVFAGGPSHTIAAQGFGDPEQQVWFLAWLPHALGSGLDPFVSHAMFAPAGINLMANSSILLPALLLSPVTVLFGPMVAFAVACVLAPAASAFAAFVAFRRYAPSAAASFFGGLLYGFSPFVLHELADGHLHVTLLVLPPLVLMVLDDLVVSRRGSALGRGVLLGVLLACQFLTSLEVLAMVVVLSVCGCVLLALRFPRRVRARLRRVATGLGAAVVTGGVLVAYPTWVLLAGPRRYKGPVFRVAGAYVVWLKAILWPIGGSPPAVWAAYVGLPVLVVVAGGLVLVRRSSARNPATSAGPIPAPGTSGEEGPPSEAAVLRFAVVMALVSYVFAFGGSLHITPRVGTGIPLPDRVLSHLPLLENMLPVRYAAMADLFLALALAVTLDRLVATLSGRFATRSAAGLARRGLAAARRLGAPAAASLLGVAVLVSPFLGSGWPYAARPLDVPAVYRSPALTSRLPASTELVGLPIPNGFLADPLAWQAVEAMPYELVAGYGFVPGRRGGPVGSLQPNAVSTAFADAEVGLLPPSPARSEVLSVRRQLRAWGVSALVVLPIPKQPARLADLLVAATGAQPRRLDGAWVWTGLHWG